MTDLVSLQGYAWKHLPDGYIVQKNVAISEEMLYLNQGMIPGTPMDKYEAVPVYYNGKRWVEQQIADNEWHEDSPGH